MSIPERVLTGTLVVFMSKKHNVRVGPWVDGVLTVPHVIHHIVHSHYLVHVQMVLVNAELAIINGR